MPDPTRHRRVKELFLEASQREPDEQGAYLETACDGDRSLRADVEDLLRAECARPGFLEDSPADRFARRTADELLAVPDRIGAFRIVRLIGSGGMGHVFEAEQDDPRRSVALKVLRFGLASTDVRRRFELEKNVLARLRHPGIVPIFEAGTAEIHGGLQPYFAMELVDGMELTSYVRSNDLSAHDRVELFARIADAVAHAHQNGVIHRDLKPVNILVTADGQPKVLDFGIARAVDSGIAGSTFGTAVAQIIGTLPYMSPEQATAGPEQVDARCDVYGLGVILYELLTDSLPYELADLPLPQAVRVICEHAPRSISAIRRGLHPDLQTIVGKALEKEPARRYDSVEALAADVRRQLRGEPIEARAAGRLYRVVRFVRCNRLLSSVAAVLIATMLVGAYFWHELTHAAAEERRVAYLATIAAVSRALEVDSLDSVAVARKQLDGTPVELREWEWHFLSNRIEQAVGETAQEGILVLREHESYVYPVAMSADGALIASGDWSGKVRLWAADSGAAIQVLDGGVGYLRDLAFDPAGGRLVSVAERSVRVWDTGTGEMVQRIGSGGAFAAAFSPDGSLLVIGHGTQVELLDGRTLEPKAMAAAPAGVVAFTADGRWIASASGAKGGQPERITVWNSASLDSVFEWDSPARVTALSFCPDGSRLASGDARGDVRIWDVRGRRREPLLTWAAHRREAFALTHLGERRVASGGRDGLIRIWEADTGQEVMTLRGHSDYVYSLACSPDGSRFVSSSGDKSVRIWETTPLASRIEAARTVERSGSTVRPPPVRVNRVLELNGSSAVGVDAQHAIAELTEFTLECWVRGERPTQPAALISNSQGEGFGIFARLDKLPPRGPFPRGMAYVLNDRALPAVTAPGEWRWQTWTHVALCLDRESLALFVNGACVDRVDVTDRLRRSEAPLYVGADAGPEGETEAFFRGWIDEVRLSRIARYHDTFTPAAVHETDADTELLLHFDGTIRGFHPDASGRDHHGRSVGHPRLVAEPR